MNIYLQKAPSLFKGRVKITGSKSESNRLLLLSALFPGIEIQNLSNSDDTAVMKKALGVSSGKVDIHHAGTAMRFLTAYFALQEGKEVLLTGSQRMTERPVKILVDVLKEMGASIEYVQNEGYPPLRISGKKIQAARVSLPGNVSSQYISALLLNAPILPKGLEIELTGSITSVPYIKMTLELLEQIGVKTQFEGQTLRVWPIKKIPEQRITVESDWSSASYYYSLLALSEPGSEIALQSYKKNSLQGDSILRELYTFFGVNSAFTDDTLLLQKKHAPVQDHFEADLTNAPDIAQTLAVSCFGLGISCELTGLHTLKIKETDRLVALQNELTKLGGTVRVTDKSLHLSKSQNILTDVAISTYNDHRMAMSFAPLATKVSLIINDAGVVSKSYPDFWKDLGRLGFVFKEIR